MAAGEAVPRDGVASSAGPPPEAMREVVERVRQITRENERIFQQLIAGESRFRRLAKAVWQVQEEERRRLARELHDGLGQTLTALTNQLERLEQKAAVANPAGDLGDLKAGIGDSIELARGALHETRELSRLLRPPVLDDLGLLPALTWLARTLGQRTGLAVEVHAENLGERLPPDLETLVFRLVQEALTNVLKHAAVRSAEVHLARRAGALVLRVVDAGEGFDPDAALDGGEATPGSGLRGMRDRIELFGGRFEVRSAPGQGTTLTAQVPMAGAESARGA